MVTLRWPAGTKHCDTALEGILCAREHLGETAGVDQIGSHCLLRGPHARQACSNPGRSKHSERAWDPNQRKVGAASAAPTIGA